MRYILLVLAPDNLKHVLLLRFLLRCRDILPMRQYPYLNMHIRVQKPIRANLPFQKVPQSLNPVRQRVLRARSWDICQNLLQMAGN